ncbi:extracellular solute-binding protein [Aliiroseovarius sp. 2305UL8-7]|uniref:extracellular solute-binding protein n=1 Tax=Aliiroseovarius conchicola TaxID=3121637 RepID=UPI003527B010
MNSAKTGVIDQRDRRPQMFALGLATSVALLLTPFAARAETTISHGFSNFGDLKYSEGFAHLDYVNPDAPKGGKISLSSIGNFDSFNLFTRKGNPAALTTIGMERILVSTADDPYGLYCFLCTTMEYPDDLSWVIFNLRDDVTFQDGSPLTAEDIAFSNSIVLEQGIAEYRAVVSAYLKSVEVLGDHRIKFEFNDDAPLRERIGFAGGTLALSKNWFEENNVRLDERNDAPFMSTGPYVLDDFEYNRYVEYKRNPDYWGADQPLSIGQNNYDLIRVVYFADSSAAFEGFKAGEYTFRTENTSKQWATGYDFPAIQRGDVIKAELPNGSVGLAQSFIFNMDRPTWQNPDVREAVRLMFNFEWSNKALFYGIYSRVDSFWPGSELAASGPPSDGEAALLKPLVDQGLLNASILTDDAALPPVSDEKRNQPERRALRAAGKLLDEAGWVIGDDGVRRKDGKPLELVFLSFQPSFDRVINPFIENLQRLGVQARLERVDSAQYVEREREGDFDVTTHSIRLGYEPGAGLKQWFDSSTADDSSRNLMRLRNPAVDALIPRVVEASNLEELTTAVHALDRVLRSIGFTVPQWYKNVHTVAYYDMLEHPENLPPLSLGELSFWWVNEEKAEALKASGAIK